MTRPWMDHFPIGDLLDRATPTPDDPDTVAELARALVARLRSLPHHREDRVLRMLVDDLAGAGTLQQFDNDWDYIAAWGDQDHVRLLFCTGSTTVSKPGRPFCRECADWFVMNPSHHPAIDHPDLIVAVDAWCELTGTEPEHVRQDADFVAVAYVLEDAGLLGFRNHDGHQGDITPTAYAEAAGLAALVMLAGAELAALRRTPVPEATERVWAHVRDHLGRPTGYEREPDRLAALIHNGTPREAM